VTYHGLVPRGYSEIDPALDGSLVTAEMFGRQLQLLKKKYNVISPEQFSRWLDAQDEVPPHAILLTCDDGLQNTLEMLPILADEGLSCLFFVTGGSLENSGAMLWHEELYLMFLDAAETFTLDFVELGGAMHAAGRHGKRLLWAELLKKLSRYGVSTRDKFLADIRDQLGLSSDWRSSLLQDSAAAQRFVQLDLAGLRQLLAAGMTIGAHTMSHPVLCDAPQEIASSEIGESRLALEQALGQRVWAFAYPFGDSNAVSLRELGMAEAAGFRCAFLNAAGGFRPDFPRFAIPRVHVTHDMGLSEFEAHVCGFYELLRRTLRWNSSGLTFTPQPVRATP
jgi:peptidoglycan/xylan/chitin deacetylase (PgdA/CDA1 family)